MGESRFPHADVTGKNRFRDRGLAVSIAPPFGLPRSQGGVPMSPKHLRGRALGRPLTVATVVIALFVAALVTGVLRSSSSAGSAGSAAASRVGAEQAGLSPVMQRKLASSETFSPGETAYEGSQETGDGAAEWTMHATPGTDIPLAAVNGSRSDFKALKTRGNAAGTLDNNGLWTNLGPDNAV